MSCESTATVRRPIQPTEGILAPKVAARYTLGEPLMISVPESCPGPDNCLVLKVAKMAGSRMNTSHCVYNSRKD